MERNLTSGSVWKNIFYFSLPYLLSYFLQTLYGMADLFIIGQFEGVAGTTAVSIGSQCSDRACGNSEKEYRDLCFEKGLQATAPCDGTDSQDRDSGSHAGRADPDCIYHYHDHCKPPWFK